MDSLKPHTDAALEAAIRDLLARSAVAPMDPVRARIMQAVTAPEAMLAALEFAQPRARKRR